MNINKKQLVPYSSKGTSLQRWGEENPFLALHRQMNRLFDDFFRGWDLSPLDRWEKGLKSYAPSVNVMDGPKQLQVTIELPGMDAKDIDVRVTGQELMIRGQKKEEVEHKNRNYYRSERSFGAFQRRIPLPVQVDPENVEAAFKKGLLTITLPKTGEQRAEAKKIPVKTD